MEVYQWKLWLEMGKVYFKSFAHLLHLRSYRLMREEIPKYTWGKKLVFLVVQK